MCFRCKNSYIVLPGIFDAGFLFAGKGLMPPAKKITREAKPSGCVYFLLFVINLGETVEVNFQLNFFTFLQLFPFGKIHVVFFCLGLAFLSLICSGYGVVFLFAACSLAIFEL